MEDLIEFAKKKLKEIESRKAIVRSNLETYCRLAQRDTANKEKMFDESKGLFVSGKERQISYASQIWMILAGVIDMNKTKEVLDRLEKHKDAIKLISPYAYHHYIQALIDAGETEKAYGKMHDYWDGMIKKGCDTFWEIYDPKDPDASPYGGLAVHSFCHAWSCTPTYFLRKYFVKKQS